MEKSQKLYKNKTWRVFSSKHYTPLGLFCFHKQSVMFFSFTYNIDLLVYFLNKY